MMMSRKAKSIWAAILCLALLFTELPFMQFTSIGAVYAEGTESFSNSAFEEEAESGDYADEEDYEDGDIELLGAGGKYIKLIFPDGTNEIYTEFDLDELTTGGWLNKDSYVIWYSDAEGFVLKENLRANIEISGLNCIFNLDGHDLIGTAEFAVLKILNKAKVTLRGGEEGGFSGSVYSERSIIADEGGLIANYAELKLENLTLGNTEHKLQAKSGTGIWNKKTLNLKNVMLCGLEASENGAGIYNRPTGTVTLENTKFIGLRAAGNGGAVWNSGTLKISGTVSFTSNSAGGKGKDLYLDEGKRKLANGTEKICGNVTIDGNINAFDVYNAGTLCVNGVLKTDSLENSGILKSGEITDSTTCLYDVNADVLNSGTVESGNFDPGIEGGTVSKEGNVKIAYLVRSMKGNVTNLEHEFLTYGKTIRDAMSEKRAFKNLTWYESGNEVSDSDTVMTAAQGTLQLVSAIKVNFETCCETKVEAKVVEEADFEFIFPTISREGYTLEGWYKDINLTQFGGTPGGLGTDPACGCYYAKWRKQAGRYTISFETNCDQKLSDLSVVAGNYCSIPKISRTGYELAGWYTEPEFTNRWDSSRSFKPTSDMKFYAKWRAYNCIVAFVTNCSQTAKTQTVQYGNKVQFPNLNRELYTLTGWYTDEKFKNRWEEDQPVTGSMTLYAKWEKNATPVYFYGFEQSEMKVQYVLKGTTVSKPEDPEKRGYTFIGWFTEKTGRNLYDFSQPVNGKLYLYSVWMPIDSVTVTYDPLNDDEVLAESYYLGEKLQKPEDPGRPGYRFTGWYYGDEIKTKWDFEKYTVTGNVKLSAGWERLPGYKVTFQTNGGSSVPVQTVYQGGCAEEPETEKAGYVFFRWCTDKQCTVSYDFDLPVESDLVLYAQWKTETVTKRYISFESNGGTKVGQQVVAAGQLLSKPQDPEKESFCFSGWYKDAALTEKYDFSQPVSDSFTLYAGWELKPLIPVTVTFDYGYDSVQRIQKLLPGAKADKPEDPIRRAYFFTGWYLGASCAKRWDFDTPVTEDLKLYAGWKKKQVFTVCFDTEGGSSVADQTVYEGDSVKRPAADPEKNGRVFYRWCEDPERSIAYDFSKPVTAGMTLYAQWKEPDSAFVTLEFETGTGSKVSAQKISRGDTARKPDDPVLKYYAFCGWFKDPEYKESYDFSTPVTTDTKLYAKWEEKEESLYEVRFHYEEDEEPEVYLVCLKETVEEPEPEPEREDDIFLGWYADKACTDLWDFDTPVEADLDLYAGWREKEQLTVRFESAGGSAVPEQKVKELDQAEKPENPVREGYTFLGWYEEEAGFTDPYNFDAEVWEDLVLYARWQKIIAESVTVSYDPCNGKSVLKLNVEKGGIAEAPYDPERSGYSFEGWYLDQAGTQKYGFDQPVQKDLRLYALWKVLPATAFTVCFHYGYEKRKEYQTVLPGGTVMEPVMPEQDDYFFIGWYSNDARTKRFDFDTPILEDTSLWAGWKLKKDLTVSFDSLGGTAVPAQTVLEKDKAKRPETEPVRDGFVFCGWSKKENGREQYDFAEPVTADLKLYAIWLPEETTPVTVSFYTYGGSSVPTQILKKGDTALEPEEPEKEAYFFAGWFTDRLCENRYEFNRPVTENLVLYAGWELDPDRECVVLFLDKDGSVLRDVEVPAGTVLDEPDEPARDDAFFIGWYQDEEITELWNFANQINDDLLLYAGWQAKKVFKVRFHSGDGFTEAAVTEEESAEEPEIPVREGYHFGGWYTDEEFLSAYDFLEPVTDDLDLYACWIDEEAEIVYVSFDSNGGTPVGRQAVASGSNARKPNDPSRTGYEFDGWFTEEAGKNRYDFAAAVTKNLKLFAGWIRKILQLFTIRFETFGGSSIESQKVASGSNAVRPQKDPEKAGYRFKGWYEDENLTKVWDFDTEIKEDRTVYAGWDITPVWTVRFECNGGSTVADQKITDGQKVTEPEDPVREGYIFLFWCADADYSNIYDFDSAVTMDTVLYARWLSEDELYCTVTFDSCGGSAVAEQKIMVYERISRPVDPVRSGYAFTGWYRDAGGTDPFDFSQEVTEDLKLYAGWRYNGGGGSSGGGSYSSGSSGKAGPVTMDALASDRSLYGTWKQDTVGWWISKPDGSWPKSEWVYCTWNGVYNWYHFNENGYMDTGFITDKDGKRYYLHTAETGSTGAMAFGWVEIESKWYYFGKSGDPKGYGAMYVNCRTPDGYTVAKDGVWTGK